MSIGSKQGVAPAGPAGGYVAAAQGPRGVASSLRASAPPPAGMPGHVYRPVPGIGEAPQWAYDGRNSYLVTDVSGPHEPFTPMYCRTPNATGPTYLIQSEIIVGRGDPRLWASPTPMPLSIGLQIY